MPFVSEVDTDEKENKCLIAEQQPQIIAPSITANTNDNEDEIEEIIVSRFTDLSSSSFSASTDVVSSVVCTLITTLTTTTSSLNNNTINTLKDVESQKSNKECKNDIYMQSINSSFDINIKKWSSVSVKSPKKITTASALNLPTDYWLKKARNEASRLLQEWARDNMLFEHKIATVLNPRLKHLNLICSRSEKYVYFFYF